MLRHSVDVRPGDVAVGRVERAVAFAATAILAGLHLAFFLSAGALWRDEVDCVNFASLSSPAEIWSSLQFQSFPLLWTVVLRGWKSTIPGETDLGIRALGLLIGLGVVAILWRNASSLARSTPLISVVILGFNSAVIVYGDSIRGYGLGMLSGLLALGLIWEAADSPTAARLGMALLSSLVAVHCLYYNAIFVLAASAGGVSVTLKRRTWRAASAIAGSCAVSWVSLVLYAHAVRQAREWNRILHVELSRALIWSKLEEAFADTGPAVLWVWIGLTVLVIAISSGIVSRTFARDLSERERDAVLYCAVTLLIGVSAYVFFLKQLSYLTQPWYYLALMALVAGCLDAPLSLVARNVFPRIAMVVSLLLVAALTLAPVWRAVRTRKTNIDVVANKLETLVSSGDLVVVNPWYLGITFDRYYRGAAAWTTVPPMARPKLHRYDLLKEKMTSRDVMHPVLEGIRWALTTGHRVFWVGQLLLPESGDFPVEPPPAPQAPWGWNDWPYYESWGLQAGHLLKSGAMSGAEVALPMRQRASPYESASVFVFTGWWTGNGKN